MNTMQPATFGKYRIVGKLLGGGMGRVYLAEDDEAGRKVALKLIDVGTDQDTCEVLEAERRGAALQDRLSEIDPRVAHIYEAGERDGYFYIAMEYVEGQDLSEILARGPLEPQAAVGIAIEICEVLEHAHTLKAALDGHEYFGIVHGDIKPRNIRIMPDGRVKVLDFGIAKALSASRNFTRNQFGSIPYSSPERLNTGEVDAASDLWSVGVVLFEMLAGAPYFRAENIGRLEHLIRGYQAASPGLDTLPAGLRQIVARALAPQPQFRYPRAQDLEADLLAWREGRLAVAEPDADMDATRRTAAADQEATRRTAPPAGAQPPAPAPAPAAPLRRGRKNPTRRAAIWLGVFGVMAILFWMESATWKKAAALQHDIEADKVDVDAAWTRYQKLVDGTRLPMNLRGVRNALVKRLTAAADRVLAEYRDSDFTSVYQRDWERARAAAARALEVDPSDKAVKAKLRVAEAHLARINASGRNQGRTVREALEKFQEAKALASRSPDPYVGLVHLYIYNLKDVDKAEQELREAERHGYRAGKKVKAELADGYYERGDTWVRQATAAGGLPQEQDYWKRADADYAHAESLYQDIVPYGNSLSMIRRIYNNRTDVAARVSAAQETH